jgi:hypothetical protein
MSAHVCCTPTGGESSLGRAKTAGGTKANVVRAGKLGSWIGPSALLILLPKCPMCLAAYLALAGTGVSTTAAAGLRVGVIVLCLSILAYRVAKAGVRMTASNPSNRSSLPF